MQVKQLIALSALAVAASAALADDPTPEPKLTVSTLTRAEVKGDVLQARARGELLAAGEEELVAAAPARSTLSRAAVKAEVLQARASGGPRPAHCRYLRASARSGRSLIAPAARCLQGCAAITCATDAVSRLP
jgi:hypothetical protein